jgi:hypothetical protein
VLRLGGTGAASVPPARTGPRSARSKHRTPVPPARVHAEAPRLRPHHLDSTQAWQDHAVAAPCRAATPNITKSRCRTSAANLCDQPADRSPEALSFLSGCASCSSRDALRVVMMSSSQATAWRRESSRVGRQRYPERPFGDVPFIDPTSTSTAKASIRRSRSWRARRRPAWVSTAARCAPVPHRLSTHPTLTYLARIPSLDLRGIHVVGGSP